VLKNSMERCSVRFCSGTSSKYEGTDDNRNLMRIQRNKFKSMQYVTQGYAEASYHLQSAAEQRESKYRDGLE
jgi:hypothetical protein